MFFGFNTATHLKALDKSGVDHLVYDDVIRRTHYILQTNTLLKNLRENAKNCDIRPKGIMSITE
jgi:hypothetical protein